jgi:hypothetical protein
LDQVIAKQDDPDKSVRPLEQSFGKARAPMPGIGKVAQPVTVERHQCCFRARKECGTQEQKQQRQQ